MWLRRFDMIIADRRRQMPAASSGQSPTYANYPAQTLKVTGADGTRQAGFKALHLAPAGPQSVWSSFHHQRSCRSPEDGAADSSCGLWIKWPMDSFSHRALRVCASRAASGDAG